jgi:hypothetical protein
VLKRLNSRGTYLSSSDKARQVFVNDLNMDGCGRAFTVTGWIVRHKTHRDTVDVELKDATGTVWIRVPKGAAVSRGKRIRVTGSLRVNTRNAEAVTLDCSMHPEPVADLDTPYGDLDIDMQEQAARVLLSKTIRVLSDEMEDLRFTPFDSKVISTSLSDHGLEGMQVLYPGFGSAVALVTSPASQIREFLLVTGHSRAFTVGTSFSTTFRSPNAGNEARVVMGLALDMSDDDHERLLEALVQKALSTVGYTDAVVSRDGRGLRLVERDTESILASEVRPVRLHRWVQIVADRGTLIAEGAIERLSERGRLCSVTFYPGQVLSLLERTPTRRLMDLGRPRVWNT